MEPRVLGEFGSFRGHPLEYVARQRVEELRSFGAHAATLRLVRLHEAGLLELMDDLPEDRARPAPSMVGSAAPVALPSVFGAQSLDADVSLEIDLPQHRGTPQIPPIDLRGRSLLVNPGLGERRPRGRCDGIASPQLDGQLRKKRRRRYIVRVGHEVARPPSRGI